MSTFLQLCQDVARESGTFSGTVPSTVVGQTGRNLKLVGWVIEAWRQIQNAHASWRWMRAEFPSTALTTASTARYTAASWSITDFAEWIVEPSTVSMYLNATGVSDEGELAFLPDWNDWRRLYNRGTQTNNRPRHFAISPANEFCLGPVPDATYRLNGLYRKTPQVLAANADEPNCPARFHPAIVWKAVQILAEHDEAEPTALITANAKFRDYMFALERDQLPTIRIAAEPIA